MHPDVLNIGLEQASPDLESSRKILRGILAFSAPEIWMSPGNRSQPLVRAALELEKLGECCVLTHFDERGLAFAAMGTALIRRKAVLVLCTSGSAVANLLPGFCEACAQGVQLIACTADRPPEEHGIGAAQTWPHAPLLQGAVKATLELPLPDEPAYEQRLQYVLQVARNTAGPIHINCPFREPFGNLFSNSLDPVVPVQEVCQCQPTELPPALLDDWRRARRPIVTLGSSWNGVSLELIQHWHCEGAVILGDILSQHGCGTTHVHRLRDGWGTLFLQEHRKPDLWIHLGGSLLSKEFLQAMHQIAPSTWVIQDGANPWDPSRVGAKRVVVSTARAEQAWLRCTSAISFEVHSKRHSWQMWAHEQRPASQKNPGPEIQALLESFCATDSEALFFVGNSMPIRHLAEWAPDRKSPPRIWANRGLNGIDGNIATMMGMAAATPAQVTAVVGDLTALHDINSLALARYAQGKVRLCILNNHGGGIFTKVSRTLPPEILRKGFITPHEFCFAGAAQQFGWAYSDAPHWPDHLMTPWIWEPAIPRC